MKKKIINGMAIVCLLIALGCGGYLLHYYYTSYKSEEAVKELSQKIDTEEEQTDESGKKKKSSLVEVDGMMVQKKFADLYRENKDFVGWIKIEDTHVDYPVMYTPEDDEDGEYYIHRDFEEDYSDAGLPFIDQNCEIEYPTDNIIIYGHNMNSGTMFHDILQYENQEFYEQHKTFSFDTLFENGTYEVVAMFYGQILEEQSKEFKYYEFVNAADEEEFDDFIKNIKAMSIIDTGVEVEYGDKLVTLSTCAYHVEDGRFAVVARKKY